MQVDDLIKHSFLFNGSVRTILTPLRKTETIVHSSGYLTHYNKTTNMNNIPSKIRNTFFISKIGLNNIYKKLINKDSDKFTSRESITPSKVEMEDMLRNKIKDFEEIHNSNHEKENLVMKNL